MTDPIAALRAQFLERCRADLAALAGSSADDPDRGAIVHRLAGAAGSFGFPALGEAAAILDLARIEGRSPTAEDFDTLIRNLEAAIAGRA